MMLCYDGKLSLYCFVTASVIAGLPEILFRLEFDNYMSYLQNMWVIHILLYGFLNLLLALAFRGFAYRVAVRATFLGYVFAVGILIFFCSSASWQMFGIYISVLAFFHYSEFLAIAWTNPDTVSIESFILNHSLAYGIAACSSWLEFIVERYFFPTIKEASSISYFGLVLCLGGEVLRKMAIFTAKRNFSHIVQNKKAENHELVTHGVYGFCRHPSYVGWFYWSIGTQLILQNPFCFVAYAITSWRFFHERVLIEELTLLNFFRGQYVDYQKKVGTGLPFIVGYKVEL
ncbi:protein-S-isoprenylcysteine O-methyltransferase [Cephus cinctus]|uniref:Protein-S-isoprenylcysteine O-methyltransferase n=1 Tax=Cephus cinctus TaxID=211228 RepID=A0AAJ7C319_CEPCN|nr:protein-S-isoprenylcysteine O-methyltransferase [Cephus cinctus]